MIEIDGSYSEGGGQILRTATALSAVTKKPCRIFNIRKSRPKPGLATQHLLGLQALAKLCGGELNGDFLGSREVSFTPHEIQSDRLQIKIPTAGSITLVLQSLILPSLFAQNPVSPVRNQGISNGVNITFEGGATDTHFSPTIDYFRYVFLKILEKMSPNQNILRQAQDKESGSGQDGQIEIKIEKRGFYPKGGAKVEVVISPLLRQGFGGQATKLKPLNLTERGELQKILVISGASEILKTKKVAERQLAGVREILGKLKLPAEEKIEYYQTDCPGSQVCLIAEFENSVIGTDGLGKIGKRAEDIGKEAVLELLAEVKSEACFDKHMADQILPYLALAEGKSAVTVSEITNHFKTNVWVIEKFLDGKFEIKNNLVSWQQ